VKLRRTASERKVQRAAKRPYDAEPSRLTSEGNVSMLDCPNEWRTACSKACINQHMQIAAMQCNALLAAMACTGAAEEI
jgi:hypothetical protein